MTTAQATIAERGESTDRLLGFSDAVFAIAITFLALDLGDIPEDFKSDSDVSSFLRHHAVGYLVYFATFLMVGFLWWRHRLVFRHIVRRSPALTWLNVALLSLVAMLPYPAGILGESATFGLGLALVLLLVPLTAISLLLWALWELARARGLTAPDVPVSFHKYVRSTVLSTPIVLGAALLLAAISWLQDTSTFFYAALGVCGLMLIAPFALDRIWPRPTETMIPAKGFDNSASEQDEVRLPAGSQPVPAQRSLTSIWDRFRLESENTRFLNFTDGVFAISVTVLVLQLRPPPLSSTGAVTTQSILDNVSQMPWPQYLTTFFLISLFWIHHVRVFEDVVRIDTILLWLNLILLMFVAFMPLPSELNDSTNNSVPALLLYLGTMSMISGTMAVIRIYTLEAKGVEIAEDVDIHDRRMRMIRSVWMAAAFVIPTIIIAITQQAVFAFGIILIILVRRPLLRVYQQRRSVR